jgi:hypothetical protein
MTAPTCEGCPWERWGRIGQAVELRLQLRELVADLLDEGYDDEPEAWPAPTLVAVNGKRVRATKGSTS